MDDLVVKAQAMDEQEQREDYEQGMKAGVEWAKEGQSPRMLRRLAKEDFSQWDWSNERANAFGVANAVLQVLEDEHVERGDSETFWEAELGDPYPEGPLLEGFVDGALAAWDTIKGKL